MQCDLQAVLSLRYLWQKVLGARHLVTQHTRTNFPLHRYLLAANLAYPLQGSAKVCFHVHIVKLLIDMAACWCSFATANLHTTNIQKERRTEKHTKEKNKHFQAKQLNTALFAGAHDRGCRSATANLHTRNDKKEKRFQAKRLNTTFFAGAHDRGCRLATASLHTRQKRHDRKEKRFQANRLNKN